MKKGPIIIAVIVVALGALAAWYSWGARHAPAGQPPLLALTPATFATFSARFNAQPQRTRLLLLLSPT